MVSRGPGTQGSVPAPPRVARGLVPGSSRRALLSDEFDNLPVAAVDLGSNSFHMVVARVIRTHIDMVDRLRERVGLAAGLDAQGFLDQEAEDRALKCLERFGERLRGIPTGNVRAVGTNTLRRARNAWDFLARAQEVLGHPIEVISGAEEARLIYLGVAHTLAEEAGRRLVVDIGGGSTECIVGERFEPIATRSLEMGCVTYSQRFFPEGELTKEAFKVAELAACQELQPSRKRFRELGWQEVIGASGTVRAVADILKAGGNGEQGITARGIVKLRKAMIAAAKVKALELPGLQSDRKPVLPGGLAILAAVFRTLGIERMAPSQGALREGLLYDLLGRIRHVDVRDQTVRNFSERFHADLKQAARVECTALDLLERVGGAWGLTGETPRSFLSWAARLHEIGMSLSYAGYHRHGAYIIENGNLPGFSEQDETVLATLVRCHRRKLNKQLLESLPPQHAAMTLQLCLLLRLAVCLHRSRSQHMNLSGLRVDAQPRRVKLAFPDGWLATHPLIRADLEQESIYWKAVDWELAVD